VGNDPINATDPSGLCPQCIAAIWGGLSGGISGGISGWMTAGSNATRAEKVTDALIGGAVGIGVGAATGAALQPQLASVLSVQAVAGVLGTVVSNPATTAITQAVNSQPIRPMENFTWGNVTPGLVGAVAGPATVGAARVGATLVNATLGGVQSITGASSAGLIGIEGKIFGGATEMLSSAVNGVVAGALGASQPTPPYVTPSSAYYGNSVSWSK
jgi:hypothetical protein